ncbi:hypothetical protein HAX54_011111 [Datura stramonium]|uniref:Uncharacterized protein n=1 Tax=Datura stramonium TaxID=4076 RepID=A0ABS8WW95_DATST|nr:hypothetical protein [Datura stramonium]
MQTEARVGVVMDGGGSGGGGGCGRGAVVVDGGASRKLITQHRQQSQIGTVPQLLAGGVAGAISKTCTAPLARLTILFQLQGMHTDAANLKKVSLWQEASRIVREEGFRAFWKGNLVTIAHRLPYSSISFYAFERYKNVLQLILGVESQGENITADLCIRLVGGGLAGITAASVTYPLDLVRTRLAAQSYHQALGKVYNRQNTNFTPLPLSVQLTCKEIRLVISNPDARHLPFIQLKGSFGKTR